MQGEAILGILLAGHAEVLPLRKTVQLSQVARVYYQLTERRLLAWRALKVVVAKSPGVLGERLTGAISAVSGGSHELIYHLLMLYKFGLAPHQGPFPPERRVEHSDSEDCFSSSEGWNTP